MEENDMGEPALKLVETTEVETKALTIVDQAKAVKVMDAVTYTAAGALWKAIGDMIKEVKDTFDPICEKLHVAHREATTKRSKYLDPLTAAQKSVKGLMSAYDQEQDRLRREEQARLEAIARKQEEERRLQEAIEAEEAMKAQGATKEAAAEVAQQVIETPVYVAPVVIPKAVPKMQGGPVYREIWSAECVDIVMLCRAVAEGKASRECVLPNMPTLNKMATALKSTMNIPGVRAASRRV
jgi:hypothetical protein